MSKQNIYDNEEFFEDFKEKRTSEINFNECLETPIILSMLPDIKEKRILDIGCGMGQHAKRYSDMGAKSVIGIDISRKMIEYAQENNNAKNISYLQIPMEDIDNINNKFDIVTSSLAFDYIENFDALLVKIYDLLNENGILVFSTSHPMATACDAAYPRFTRNDMGKRLYANVVNYGIEGRRVIKRVVDEYELYHRTISSIINSIIKAGFLIEKCRESIASKKLTKKVPEKFDGTIHRPDFIFFRCRKIQRLISNLLCPDIQ